MRRLLLLCLLLPSFAQAEAPFDLRALREEHPAVPGVILERQRTISRPEPGILRVATVVRRAVLDESDKDDLSLFSEDERPGCRTLGGVRLSVTDRDGVERVTTNADLIRIPKGNHSRWSGPRRGVGAGSLLVDSWHVDLSLACFDGLMGVHGELGDPEEPVLVDRVVNRCEDCVDTVFGGPERFAGEPGDRRLELADLPPAVQGPYSPTLQLASYYVATESDPAAIGHRIEARLPAATAQWKRDAAGWVRGFHAAQAGEPNAALRVARGLAKVPVYSHRTFWVEGLAVGEPCPAEARRLLPLEWLALANASLERYGGVPVLLAEQGGRPPADIASIFDWQQPGVLLPGLGLVTTAGFWPLVQGSHPDLIDGKLLRLDGSGAIEQLGTSAALRAERWESTVRPNGIASQLLEVQLHSGSGQHLELASDWRVGLAAARKADRKADAKELARTFASQRIFEGRPLAATELSVDEGGALSVSTAWSLKDSLVRVEGATLVPVPVLGLPSFVPVGPERAQPIRLGARALAGVTRAEPPSGQRFEGLPEDLAVEQGPIRFTARWALEGNVAALRWELVVDEEELPPELAGTLNALVAALSTLHRTVLVSTPNEGGTR